MKVLKKKKKLKRIKSKEVESEAFSPAPSPLVKHDPSAIPTSIIISGVESDRYWDIVVNKCNSKTVLMSYHYIQKKGSAFLEERLKKTPDVRVFIDSGAFTFMTNQEEFRNMPDKFWTDYLEKYTGFIKDHADLIFACADLDIDKIVGEEQVDRYREEYFEPLKDLGIDVCYIWHEERGFEGWKRMCEKYDYIGLSTENDSLSVQQLTKMINYAKKCNTRVHGMALTKTELLVRIPFFSCDSTTWLVGQQYGELNWFDGRKMRRLEKREWRTTYKTRLLKAPFFADWDLLINGMGGRGDTYELLRLNVIAYHLAEGHIRKRLRTKMYWLRENNEDKEVPKKEIHSLAEAHIPTLEWFDGDCEDYKTYLYDLGFSTDMSKDEATNLLYSIYIYCIDTSLLEEEDTQNMYDYCKGVLDKEPSSREEAIALISSFLSANVLGERNDFADEEVEGTSAPKERSSYVKDDEYITINISSDDLKATLPPPEGTSMPEVDAYDKELARRNINVVRDSHGRFVSGTQKVRKPKSVYSKVLPKLACDTCYKAGDCEQYKPGYVCAFSKEFKKFDTRNMDDIMDAMNSMANVNLERMQRAMMFEVMDGGMTVPEVNGLIDQNMRILKQISELNNARAVVTQKSVLREDGTQETVTHMSVNPQGGILSKIFGMPSRDDEEDEGDNSREVHDVDYKVE